MVIRSIFLIMPDSRIAGVSALTHPFTHTTCFSVCSTSTKITLRRHHLINRLVSRRRFINHRLIHAAFHPRNGAFMLIQRHTAFRLSTRHHAPRTVAATAKTFGITQPAHDEGFRPHAARNNPNLTFLRLCASPTHPCRNGVRG